MLDTQCDAVILVDNGEEWSISKRCKNNSKCQKLTNEKGEFININLKCLTQSDVNGKCNGKNQDVRMIIYV